MSWHTWKALRLAILPVLLYGLSAAPLPAQVSGARPAEYMIYQYPNVDLVIVVDAQEAEFDVQILGPEKALLKEAGIAGRRLGPVYQYVAAAELPRQLMIKVNPGRRIDRSRISMELLQMTGNDRMAAALARAYKLLSVGMERLYATDTSSWAAKSYSLASAARAFADLGMEEMRLWSDYYATHLTLHRLDDPLLAIERSRQIQQSAARAGFERIELVALILEGDALMRAAMQANGKQAFSRLESAHPVLERIVVLADQQGLQAERGRALFNDGLAYEQQVRPDRAIERYNQALEVTFEADDQELLNRIRSTAAAAYESQGSTAGAIGMLDDIATDLSSEDQEDAGLELADNLFEKGRLLNNTYRFAEAAAELSRALELQTAARASADRGITGLELGWSLYSQGYLEQAAALIEESIQRVSSNSKRAAESRARGVLASVYRFQGRFDEMAENRSRQADLTGSGDGRADVLFETALDSIAVHGPDAPVVSRLLGQSAQAARSSGNRRVASRAALYRCLADLNGNRSSDCADGEGLSAYRELSASGIPAVMMDAAFAWSGILERRGNRRDARRQMSRVIEDLHFYRAGLNGVLGAWYWTRKADIFSEYAAMMLGAGGAELLLALERIRRLENASGSQADHEVLRSDIARLEANAGEGGSAELARQVNARIEGLGSVVEAEWRSPDNDDLDRWLRRLGANESLLAFHFAEDAVYALPAGREGVGLVRISNASGIRNQLASLRDQLGSGVGSAPNVTLDALGAALVGPVIGQLEQRVFLLPAGPLNGLPLDAFRLRGKYLAASHQVINLGSLSSLGMAPALAADYGARVFLAGNPQSGQDLFSYGVSTSTEIAAVRDRFVGEGLHIVQGVALHRDEFADPRFAGASLIHLAMPGRVDLAFPERSRLLLSGSRDDPSAEFLTAADIRGFRLSADLAVLSATAFAEQSASPMDSQLGLISELHEAGVSRVVATLWPAGDRETAAFMSELYATLAVEADIAAALFNTRRKRLDSENAANFGSWAGFQLFIR